VCLAVVASAATAPTSALAAPDTTLVLPQLSRPASVVTDRFGIPHLRAENLADLYLAWGLVTARDRLWQLEFTRRSARGEMWRWIGNRALLADGGAQLFELRERAERIWARDRSDPDLAQAIERYVAGINAYLALCRAGARAWPRELRLLKREPNDFAPADVVLVLLAQGLVLDLNLPELTEAKEIREHGLAWVEARQRFENEVRYPTIPDSAAARLYGRARRPLLPGTPFPSDAPRSGGRPTPPERLAAEARRRLGPWLGPGEEERERASNAFAVGRRRSASGAPLLANDPHLALGAPGPLQIVHVEVPGEVDAIGACVPGLPMIVSGRNRACAWGVTALSADVMDVYADTLSRDRRQVRWQGGWVPIRDQPYAMRFRMLGFLSLPPFGHRRRYTPHGPVLAFDKERRVALSLRWAVDDSAVTLARLVGLERSHGAAELAERARTLVTPGLNLVAADTSGTVLYQANGRIPRRGWEPKPGPLPADGRHEWLGLMPADAMPAWQAPPDGFVVSANNLPVGSPYPEALPRYEWPHDRALRIAERLAGDSTVTLDDLRSVQNDVHSRAAARLVPLLVAAADSLRDLLTPRERAVLDTLRHWDFAARRERVAPTLFRGWYGALQRRSRLGGAMGLATAALDGRAPEALRAPERGTLESTAHAALEALRLGCAELEKKLGPDPATWRWSRAHLARFHNALDWKEPELEPPATSVDGDNSTPCAAPSALPWRLSVLHGPVFRHLVDLADPDSSLGVVVPGNAGEGPHRDDQLQRWANHGYVPLLLSRERIEAAKESELRLVPAER
jgi:penicillin amidase